MRDFPMHPALLLTMTGAMLLASAIASAGETRVGFMQPENFTDARLNGHGGGADAIVLSTMEHHLQQLGSACLPAGQTLDIRIHDIDLAGRVEWWHGPFGQTRVMREITWPRIKLSHAVRDGGQTGEGTYQEISDISYLSESPYLRSDSMPLPYERVMLTRWFERQFCRK